MKKLTLIAVLIIIAIVFLATTPWAAELNNVTSKGVDGNLVFYDASGNEIMSLEAANRLLTFPSGSGIDVESGASLKLNGTAIITAPTVTSLDTTWAVSSHEYTTTADWEMSGTEAKSLLLTVTSGAGAGDRNVIAPDVSGRLYIVRNDTTAGGSAVIKKSGGTGVSIASGKTATVIHNGSDYIRVTADQTH